MKFRSIALVAILSSCISNALPAEEVTKENLQAVCPKLEIKRKEAKGGWMEIEINIPANEARFKRLFQTWFVMSDSDGKFLFSIPIKIVDVEGAKRISVYATPEMIKTAKVQIDCKVGDPTMSILDTVTLVLPSLVETNK